MKKALFITFILLTLCVCIFIFYMSSQNSGTSTELSFGIITKLNDMFGFDADRKVLKFAEKILRKSAHFGIYTVLGAFIMTTISIIKRPNLKMICLSVALSFIYAITDEYHQTFVSGRSGELRDVLIDTSGALLGSLIIYLISLAVYKKRKSI